MTSASSAARGGETLSAAIAALPFDPTGRSTFERYIWQAKQALRLWLTTLGVDGPTQVLCEHVEDVTVLGDHYARFVQLKTRDQGSWSFAKICQNGLQTLVSNYLMTRAEDVARSSRFELWLEGPVGGTVTRSFVENPTSATASQRNALERLGIAQSEVDGFLARLSIYPAQPSRIYIDSVLFAEISALWPSLVNVEVAALCERLLARVEEAQGAEDSRSVSRAAIDGLLDPSGRGRIYSSTQRLTRDELIRSSPPRPPDSTEALLRRIGGGSTSSMLELKLQRAGAAKGTVDDVIGLRATADRKRQVLLATGPGAEAQLEELADRTLRFARNIAILVDGRSSSAPASSSAARPAESVVAELLTRPLDLGALDVNGLFGCDGQAVFGFLAHLSDECRFPWRA